MAKKGKQQEREAKAKGSWQKVDLAEYELEGFDDGGAAFELEELTEYTIEQDEFGGKVLKAVDGAPTVTKKKKQRKRKASIEEEDVVEEIAEPIVHENVVSEVKEEGKKSKKKRSRKKKNAQTEAITNENDNAEVDEAVDDDNAEENNQEDEQVEEEISSEPFPEWAKYKLHPKINLALRRVGSAPTEIQAKTLHPAVIEHRDVVGAAPTGSGKTLAFGLPVLHHLLSHPEQEKKCRALILTPTRELAMQITDHLTKIVPNRREIGIVTLVGGMAVQKQIRQLSYSPEIVVATPGRLWEVMEAGETTHFAELNADLQFLIVDEADRMLQPGSFPQLQKIFEYINKNTPKPVKGKVILEESDDEEEDLPMEAAETSVVMLDDILQQHEEAKNAPEESKKPRYVRQTFLFSATMTLKNAGRYQTKRMKNPTALTVLESIMRRVGLRGKPAVVDLSVPADIVDDDDKPKKQKAGASEVTLPAGLELAQVETLDEHRNNCLYYFLTQYPGRTIVFLNAIAGVRRVAGILSLLKLPVFALHAEMQQKQRLKKLEGFRANPKGILIATDVAARGLDIPSVQYVVHYHIPRSAETFVHRSGRTARAASEGLSISLVAPIDAKYHAQICNVLRRPSGFSSFPIDHKFLPLVKERVKLAEQIFAEENQESKQKSEASWFSQMAQAADLPLDDDLMEQMNKNSSSQAIAKVLKAELNALLKEPLRPIGSKRKFWNMHEELNQLSNDGEYRARDATADLMKKIISIIWFNEEATLDSSITIPLIFILHLMEDELTPILTPTTEARQVRRSFAALLIVLLLLLVLVFAFTLPNDPAAALLAETQQHFADAFHGDLRHRCVLQSIDQLLNHFGNVNGTIEQQYYVCSEFYQVGGPLFLYLGHGHDVGIDLNTTGILWENAQEFKALLVFAQHRFVNQVVPGNEQLEYLSSEQALADYAMLLQQLKEEWKSDIAIAFGAAYGGMLATWLRIKYPHLVIGAIASSAPVLGFYGQSPDVEANARTITYDASPVAGAHPNCIPNIRATWSKIIQAAKSNAGRQRLIQAFHLCPNSFLDEQNAMDLMQWIQHAYSSMAMGNYPFSSSCMLHGDGQLPAYPVRAACDYLAADHTSSETKLLNAVRESVAIYYNASKREKCFTLGTQKNALWDYLTCTELYLPKQQNGVDDMFYNAHFNMTADSERCKKKWKVELRPLWASTVYGGRDELKASSNIVFTNGDYDPWAGNGVLSDISDSVVGIFINNAAHQYDFLFNVGKSSG
ncbi:DEAD/DEAH box RNA helicase [Thraustotheca clavata]|uniref:ATP-dependent RNA helicase n=1 Tax=Thraustotheca clavata TaxID=74557 RepID=A0A1W0A5G0_9STRA|nr:DEAD/DEAH box RNA helicase [Thraustotheca clavata]